MSLAVPPATEFPVLAQEGLVYLDSAATSQTPRPVLEAMDRYYCEYRRQHPPRRLPAGGGGDRGIRLARDKVAAFAGSTAGETVFTKNGTEAINLVAYSWGRANLGPDDTVVVTQMEHHSNIVPWQLTGGRLEWCRSTTTACSTWRRWTRRLPQAEARRRRPCVERARHRQPDRRDQARARGRRARPRRRHAGRAAHAGRRAGARRRLLRLDRPRPTG